MAYGYAKAIQNRIGAAPDGTIFIVSDFSDVADSETIRRNLNRLVQAGIFGCSGQRDHTKKPEPACAGWYTPAYFERRL